MSDQLKEKKTQHFYILIGVVIVCGLFGFIFKFDIDPVQRYISGFPVYISGLFFIILYVVATTVLWIGPKDILKIFCAGFFGANVGFALIYIGELCNAIIMFSLARSLGREYVVKRLSKKKIDQLDQTPKDTSFFGAFVLRINPLVPYRILDIASGLSKISFHKFILVYIVGAPARLYWLMLTLATVVPVVTQKAPSLYKFLKEDFAGAQMIIMEIMIEYWEVFLYSAIYFLLVLLLTGIALIVKCRQRIRGEKRS